MDSKELNKLIELISRSNFRTFEMEREGFRLKLVKDDGSEPSAAPVAPFAIPATALAAQPAAAPSPAQTPASTVERTPDDHVDLKSPIVGTFYASASPDSPPFVEVGAKIKRGQVICIVEAMKVMNEIESEINAEVVEVLVDNGQPVEFGEVLFRLRAL